MRISELLGRAAFDADGKSLGRVEDVRLVQDGPIVGRFGAALRVDGVVIGGEAVGVRLGYHRANVRGPWPLRVVFRRLEQRAHFAEWDDVELAADGRVIVRGELRPVPA